MWKVYCTCLKFTFYLISTDIISLLVILHNDKIFDNYKVNINISIFMKSYSLPRYLKIDKLIKHLRSYIKLVFNYNCFFCQYKIESMANTSPQSYYIYVY